MKKAAGDPLPETFRILNRELSLLDFQVRVLEEAADARNPLLERLKFLAIFASNMDEFFMIRVSGLKRLEAAGVQYLSPDGLSAREQLRLIRKRVLKLHEQAHHLYRDELKPKLDDAGVHILNYGKLTKSQRQKADAYFSQTVFPILTPLVLDSAHPFPHISNLSLNFAIIIKGPKGKEKFARLKVPATLPPLLSIKRTTATRQDGTTVRHHTFVWLDQVIVANLSALFPGMEVVESHPFRVIRDADTELLDLEASDLVQAMQRTIKHRKFGSVVKVEIHEQMPNRIRKLLVENLGVKKTDLYEIRGTPGMDRLQLVYKETDRADLKYTHYEPSLPAPWRKLQSPGDIFNLIKQQDILLHHPYDSFAPVVEFLQAAARDPDVLAIKQTLYRVGQNSPVVGALLEAAERGKQVAVVVEIKARFDEENNISWAKELEQAGAHVIYGVEGLKTHCKTCLVVRQEGADFQRYLHIATGNYNSVTAEAYEDIGLFTCEEALVADVSNLFNTLTGYSRMPGYQGLMVAPLKLREQLVTLIDQEIRNAKDGLGGHIIIKVNALTDPAMIRSFYDASGAGVKVDLIIRGECCLVPGVPRLSENIRVISVVGRFLEHSRVFYFHNAGQERVFLGSADLMTRNLDRRVEVVFPVSDPTHIRYLRDEVLETYLQDNQSARDMCSDGDYLRLTPTADKQLINVQQHLMRKAL